MTKSTQKVFLPLFKFVEKGTKYSPWQNKYSLDCFTAATTEEKELVVEKINNTKM